MEELGALAAMALISALVVGVADVVGWLMGLGWGHYSKKGLTRRRLKESDNV